MKAATAGEEAELFVEFVEKRLYGFRGLWIATHPGNRALQMNDATRHTDANQ